MFGKLLVGSIIGFFVGLFLWLFGGFVPVLGFIGCFICLSCLAFLIISSIYREHEPDSLLGKILTIGGAVLLVIGMVSFFCYVGVVPGMPQTEIARQIYGYLALGFMLGGGGTVGGGVIVIIFF